MLYFIRGSAQEIFTAFGQQSFVLPSPKPEEERDTFIKDITRSPFLGTETQAQILYTIWSESAAFQYYAQGNIFGGILKCLFGSMPLLKEDEDIEYYQKQYNQLAFAYLDEHNVPCAFFCNFRKDQLHEWNVGLIRNTHLAPWEREIFLLSSRPFNTQTPMLIKRVSWDKNPLTLLYRSSLIQRILNLSSDGVEINPAILRINLILRYFNLSESGISLWNPIPCVDFDMKRFFAPNALFDLILANKMDRERMVTLEFLLQADQIKPVIINKLLSKDGLAHKLKLALFFVLYHADRMDLFLRLVDEEQFINGLPQQPQAPHQIAAFSILYLSQIPQPMIDSILNDEELTRVVSHYLKQKPTPALLEKIHYLASLAPSPGRSLCLYFLEHAPLTRQGYQEILQAAEKYPLMPETFFYLLRKDKLKGSSKEYVKWIVSPHYHLWPTINVQFFQNKATNPIQGPISAVAINFLHTCMQVLIVLKECSIDEESRRLQVLERSARGNFLRLLVTHLPPLPPSEKKLLLALIFKGLSQDEGEIQISHLPAALHNIGKELQQKIKIGHILLKSSAEEATYRWSVATRDLRKWQCFNALIQKIEQTFIAIEDNLRQPQSQEQLGQWQQLKIPYQRSLHRIICDALENKDEPHIVLARTKWRLRQNHRQFIHLLEPSRSLIFHILTQLANLIISLLTLTLANLIKKRYTGCGQFFKYTKSSEQLCLLRMSVEQKMDEYYSRP